jgi:hypothetical protein
MAQIDSQGTIRGQYSGWACVATYVWQKVPPPTMPFDGDYTGVSRELTNGGAGCSPSGVPATLMIRNSVVLGYWQGTVSPQGAVVMRNPKFSRVNAQIDPGGTIKGQYGDPACTITFVWRKQSG